MKTSVSEPTMREALRQSVRRLADALQALVEKVECEINGASQAELAALRYRIEGWSEEILVVCRQLPSEVTPSSLTEDGRVQRDEVDPRGLVTPEDLHQADERVRAARERGRTFRHQILEEIGPLLSTSEVAARLGVSRVAINNWRRQNRLLALQWDSHQYRYPAFQLATTPAEGEYGLVTGLPAS